MDESGFQTFNLGKLLRSGLGQSRGQGSGGAPQGMTPVQFQNFSGGLDQNIFGNPESANQGGFLQQFQNMRLGQQQNNMTGSPFSFQGGIPQQLQNMRNSLGQNTLAGFGSNFQGMVPENTTEEQEDEAEIDWDQIFQETFFPNGYPSSDEEEEDTDDAEEGEDGGGQEDGAESSQSDQLNNASNEAANVFNVRSQEDPRQTDEAQAGSNAQNGMNSRQKNPPSATNIRKKYKNVVKEKKLKSKRHGNSSVSVHEYPSHDQNATAYTPNCDFTELLQREKERALTFEDPGEDAQCTIILLDSSYNMRGEPYETAQRTLRNFLKGLVDIPDLKENISLVTFGEDLRVHQHLTCDYQRVIGALDGVRVAGQAGLSHGLALCAPVLERLTTPAVNGVECHPRILIVSDFKMMLDGDDQTVSQKLVTAAEQIVKNLQESYSVTVFCIPVVKSYQMVASQIARVGDGMVVSPANVHRLCNFYLQKLLAGFVLGEPDEIITDETIHCVISSLQFDKYIDDRDVLMIKKIIQTAAPDRQDFPDGSSAANQAQFTGRGLGGRDTSNQTKRVSFRDQLHAREKNLQQATPGVDMSRMQMGFSKLPGDTASLVNERCPADADDSSNPNSEYSDSECSVLESGLENDDRDYIWLWRDDMGEWKNYSDETNRKLEKTYKRKPRGTCVISHNGQAERVLFKVMKQRNSTLKKERDIQRLEVDPEMMKQLKSSLYGEQ